MARLFLGNWIKLDQKGVRFGEISSVALDFFGIFWTKTHQNAKVTGVAWKRIRWVILQLMDRQLAHC